MRDAMLLQENVINPNESHEKNKIKGRDKKDVMMQRRWRFLYIVECQLLRRMAITEVKKFNFMLCACVCDIVVHLFYYLILLLILYN